MSGGQRVRSVRGGVIVTLFGLFFVVVGVAGHLDFFGYPGETTGGGKVVAVDTAGRGTSYTVEFTTADGRVVTADTYLRWGGPSTAGGNAGIAYDTDDPADVRIRRNVLVLCYLGGLVGLFIAANGVAEIVRRIR
ncbi:DUF3592 domain-containing protein [Actinoplanes sp. NBRC 103695]|uniref:DUF3592 domain-containing protein n=1 Tax=Actinoplanes sp. NBRC 103695 TaxID=3032202 RepID=UPI002552B469|nr:DUF3592 domain-containing protein [Actinoplanes sp. NBRC 103695]